MMKPFTTLSKRGQMGRLKRMAEVALPAFGVAAARIV